MPLNLKLKAESSSSKLKHSKTKIKKKMFAWAPGKSILSFTCWHWKSRSLHTLQFHFNLNKDSREGWQKHICYIFDLPKRGGMKETKEKDCKQKKRKVKWDDYRQMRIRIKNPQILGKRFKNHTENRGMGIKRLSMLLMAYFFDMLFFLNVENFWAVKNFDSTVKSLENMKKNSKFWQHTFVLLGSTSLVNYSLATWKCWKSHMLILE